METSLPPGQILLSVAEATALTLPSSRFPTFCHHHVTRSDPVGAATTQLLAAISAVAHVDVLLLLGCNGAHGRWVVN
jgi:hypothetical protein